MKESKSIIIAAAAIILLGIIGLFGILFLADSSATSGADAIHSPYAGQEARSIKALSQEDIEGLLAGAGTPFGGMAKPAELNGYPGPRHLLDAVEAGQFELTSDQQNQIEVLYAEMRAEAIVLGEQILEIEESIDNAFREGIMTAALLQEGVSESADLYGQLRIVHLKYHLATVDILTPQQIAQYNELRGYTSTTDPCMAVPEGHDPELWRLHNNCDPEQ